MHARLILNPYANRWRARSRQDDVERALRAAGVNFELAATTASHQAIALARSAKPDGFDTVIAAGGDGTVSEVVNGLLSADSGSRPLPLGILPLGTGNDLSDMLAIPRDLAAAARLIAAGRTRTIDAGRVNDRFFANNAAVGMEPLVTIENIRIRRLAGNARYVLALVKALLKLSAWEMRVTWDDGEYAGPLYLLSVCNSPRNGGMFRMAPAARLDDGLFDFVLVPRVGKISVLRLLMKLFRGTHVRDARVTYARTRRLTIESVPDTPLHADGEVLTESVGRVEFTLLPACLHLFAPTAKARQP